MRSHTQTKGYLVKQSHYYFSTHTSYQGRASRLLIPRSLQYYEELFARADDTLIQIHIDICLLTCKCLLC